MAAFVGDHDYYWRYYGLEKDPFAAHSQEDNIYLAPRWEQYFDLLHYLCRSSNILLMVTGASGSGKTIFLKQFIHQFSEAAQIACLVASPVLNAAQLCAALVKEFSLPLATGAGLEEQLETHMANLQYSVRPCLLVIDKAHQLPKETLHALLYLIKQQSETQMRLHILLVGELALKEEMVALTQEEGEGNLFHHIQLEPFNLAETGAYLKHRLITAGLPAGMPLSRAAIARIQKLACGVPGRINLVARQVLLAKTQARPHYSFIDFMHFRRFWGTGGALLLALAATISVGAWQSFNKTMKPKYKPPVKIIAPAAITPPPRVELSPPVAAAVIEKAPPVIIHQPQPKPVATGHYTVQLMSLSNEAAITRFMATHATSDENHYFYLHDAVKNRYTLFYGRYATAAEAAAAARNFPEELRSLRPWVRILP